MSAKPTTYRLFLLAAVFVTVLTAGCFAAVARIGGEGNRHVNPVSSEAPECQANITSRTSGEPDSETKEAKPVRKLLVIGDSMTGWLGERLNAYGGLNGFEVATVVWDGSTISKWAKPGALERYLEEIDPDGVVVCLGMNSLFEANPSKRLKEPAEAIIKAIGDRQILWVGPPSWPGKGKGEAFNEWMETELGPGRYFNSSSLTLPRQSKTNPHPTRSGIEQWADSVARWIPRHALINLKTDSVPSSGKASRGATFIYKKMNQSI